MFSWICLFLGGFGLGSGGCCLVLFEEGEEVLIDMVSLVCVFSEDFEVGGDDDDEVLLEIEEFICVVVLLLYGDVVLVVCYWQCLN